MSRLGVLDHGYVELVEHWGSDERIIEAARMSTGKGFQGWEVLFCRVCGYKHDFKAIYCDGCGGDHLEVVTGDEKLLKFLYENQHMTPFEMGGLVIEVQAPIFVFREWHRHRTQSYNEMSARYAPLPDVNYVPTVERLMMNVGGTNKQAGTVAGSETLNRFSAATFRVDLQEKYDAAEKSYQEALRDGVPKELARIGLPVGRYSRMRASANLRNWLGFLTLRQAPGAQWEIRQYADAVGALVAELFPRTWALFSEGSKK